MSSSSQRESNLEPGLLSEHQLKTLIRNKGIWIDESLNKQDLVHLYLKHVQPQPQRGHKSRYKTNESNNSLPTSPTKATSIICLKTQNISLGDSMAKRQKRFSDKKDTSSPLSNNDQTTKMETDSPTQIPIADCLENSTKTSKKIILKRTHLAASNQPQNMSHPVKSNDESSDDDIKKSKLE